MMGVSLFSFLKLLASVGLKKSNIQHMTNGEAGREFESPVTVFSAFGTEFSLVEIFVYV